MSVPVPQPHQARQMAESFGVDAERYDRARPPYPEALLQRVLSGLSSPALVDVGCGTGIAARQFQAAGCTVLGVEPDPRMAAFARGRGLEVEVATFEEWELAGRRFDVVTAGQSWHWVDPVAGPAKAAQALREGGRLVLFAHIFEPPAEVAKAFAAALRRVVPDSRLTNLPPGRASELYQSMYDGFAQNLRACGKFGEPEQWRFDWQQAYTRDEWLDLLPTTGLLTRLSTREQDEILSDVGAAIDATGGRFVMEYTTLAVAALVSGLA